MTQSDLRAAAVVDRPRRTGQRLAELSSLLDHAVDQIERALESGSANARERAATLIRAALLTATGEARGAARLADQMLLWHRQVPERARALGRAALTARVAALLCDSVAA